MNGSEAGKPFVALPVVLSVRAVAVAMVCLFHSLSITTQHHEHHHEHQRITLLPTAWGLQLQYSWQATPRKSILATSVFLPIAATTHGPNNRQNQQQQQWLLATAGHNCGTVQLWNLPNPIGIDTNASDDNTKKYNGCISSGTDTDTGDTASLPRRVTTPIIESSIHKGSIFSIATVKNNNNNVYLLSGSFDRSATLWNVTNIDTTTNRKVVYSNNDNANDNHHDEEHMDEPQRMPLPRIHRIATLPEHTGWVRGVQLVNKGYRHASENDNSNEQQHQQQLYCLSIGCNFINVWIATIPPPTSNRVLGTNANISTDEIDTETDTTTNNRKMGASNVHTNSQRLARLDAGPSPLVSFVVSSSMSTIDNAAAAATTMSDEKEEAFRRHDILCFTVILSATTTATTGSNTNSKENNRKHADTNGDKDIIIAGLVDGTMRAFPARWDFWKERAERGECLYDATGSCKSSSAIRNRFVNDNAGENSTRATAAAMAADNDSDGDDQPCASVRAHQGRITGVHAIPNRTNYEFVSVGYDGKWCQWKLKTNAPTIATNSSTTTQKEFVLVNQGEVGGNVRSNGKDDCNLNKDNSDDDTVSEQERRICSSVIVPAVISGDTESEDHDGAVLAAFLVVGTTGGCIYRIPLFCENGTDCDSSNGKERQYHDSEYCTEVWKGTGSKKTSSERSITTLTWVPSWSEEVQGDNRSISSCKVDTQTNALEKRKYAIVAGTSNGDVHIFV